jgi:hypothetical protein
MRSAELADDVTQRRLQVEGIAGDGRSIKESLEWVAVGLEKEKKERGLPQRSG